MNSIPAMLVSGTQKSYALFTFFKLHTSQHFKTKKLSEGFSLHKPLVQLQKHQKAVKNWVFNLENRVSRKMVLL